MRVRQVGYGEITPCNEMEQLYTIAAMVIGSAMFAYIVGSISTVAMQANGQEQTMRNKVLQLQEYLELRQIPAEMAHRIRRQCIHKWKNTVFDEEGLLKEFNPKMKRKIVDFIKGDIASKVPLISLRCVRRMDCMGRFLMGWLPRWCLARIILNVTM